MESITPHIANAERIVRDCFHTVEYAWINASEDTAVFFIAEPFLTNDNYARWSSPATQHALPDGLACHIATASNGAHHHLMKPRFDTSSWQHGYFDQLLRGPRYTSDNLIGQPYRTVYLDCRHTADELKPVGMQRLRFTEFVQRYDFNDHRHTLLISLKKAISSARKLFGAVNAVWVFGSFATSQPSPNGIDAAFIIDSELYRRLENHPEKRTTLKQIERLACRPEFGRNMRVLLLPDAPGDVLLSRRKDNNDLSRSLMARGSFFGLYAMEDIALESSGQLLPLVAMRGVVEIPLDTLGALVKARDAAAAQCPEQPETAACNQHAQAARPPKDRYLFQDTARFREIAQTCSQDCGVAPQVLVREYFAFLILGQLAQRVPGIVFKGGLLLGSGRHITHRHHDDVDIALCPSAWSSPLLPTEEPDPMDTLQTALFQIIEGLGLRITSRVGHFTAFPQGFFAIQLPDFGFDDCLRLNVELALQAPIAHSEPLELSSTITRCLFRLPNPPAQYRDEPFFTLNVETVSAAFCDKILALCNAPLRAATPFATKSRHLYDLYRLAPHVRLDQQLFALLQEIRGLSPRHWYYPAEQETFNLAECLESLYSSEVYRHDYEFYLTPTLQETLSYEEASQVLPQIARWIADCSGEVILSSREQASVPCPTPSLGLLTSSTASSSA